MAGDVTQLINGVSTLSGGTRQEVKNWRPWQPKEIYQPNEKCPFCNLDSKREVIRLGEGWMVLRNASTPFKKHELLLPADCWLEEKLRFLGGKTNLRFALQYGLERIILSKDFPSFPTQFYTHIGSGAGQNWRHHHWHICWPSVEPRPFIPNFRVPSEDQVINMTNNFISAVHGIYAGQTIIFPRFRSPELIVNRLIDDDVFGDELLDEIFRTVELFNKKFKYPEPQDEVGRGPDYCLGFILNSKDDWCVVYTPKLNNWGGSEIFAPICGTPYILPWPHSATVEYLKK